MSASEEPQASFADAPDTPDVRAQVEKAIGSMLCVPNIAFT